MSASICAFILAVSTVCGLRVVSGVLSAPRNVRLTSDNMNLVLRWDSPDGAASDLVYTTEYKTTVTSYKVGCVNISTPECDFSSRISISPYGKYIGRVRAQSGAESSAWVESNQMLLDNNTIIGSPNVSLFSNGATIEVSIRDPVFATSSLRNVYTFATYNITYWKADKKEKARSHSNIQQDRVVLNKLEPWTKYCVQVQINTKTNARPSKPSTVICESTTSAEETPWVAAVVTFVVMAMAVALVVVAVVYRKSISHFLCPKDTLPQHFKEYLLAPPNALIYSAMRNSHPPEEIYHQVSIIADDRTVEEGRPLEAADSSCSRQPDLTVGER
ncbi:hypothetical protein PAMP_004208 [Pampus punctatissimus]